ncbi:hypothetical protein MYU51_006901 [Penicillium brevicompactum]
MSSFTPINAPKRSNGISASARLPTRFKSRKKANSPRRPTLRWDQLKRYVLCCIFRFFLCDGWQTSKIFSHMFRSHLAERHFQSDVGYKCLHAQWRDMGRKKNADYIHVYNATFEPGSEIGDLIKQIRAAAAFLNIKLREKRLLQLLPTRAQTDREDLPDVDSIGPQQALSHFQNIRRYALPTRARVIKPSVSAVLPVTSPYFSDPTDGYHKLAVTSHGQVCLLGHNENQGESTDNVQGTSDPVVTSHGKLCLWCYHENQSESTHSMQQTESPKVTSKDMEDPDEIDDEGFPETEIPPLLYRWFNEDSQGANCETRGPHSAKGFVSGLFCQEPYFSNDDLTDSQLENYFITHVNKLKHATPFISTSESPLAPIHRAIKSSKLAYLAVIDTTKIKTRVFLANPIAKQTDTFTKRWEGKGEYLIWGEVPRCAVAFVFPVSEIERLAAQNRDIGRLLLLRILRRSRFCDQVLRFQLAKRKKHPFKSGRTLGKFLMLLGFPRLYWEDFARRFMSCWGWHKLEDQVEFLRGLKSEIEYSEELSDSESEETPFQRAFDKLRSPASSDIEYEPSIIPGDSDSSTVTLEAWPESPNASGIMENRTETTDDGHFSTHESMSSFGLLGISLNSSPTNVPPTNIHFHEPPPNRGGHVSVVIPHQARGLHASNGQDIEDLMVLDDDGWTSL